MNASEEGNAIVSNDDADMNGEEYNEYDDMEETGVPSFANTDEEANDRENIIDVRTLGLDDGFDMDLTALKQNLYTATVYGPPVGSQAAQDIRLLEHYDGLLLQLYNLVAGVLESGVLQGVPHGEIPSNILSQYPTSTQPLVAAYYQRICDFQQLNKDRQLVDVLKDFLQRRLKEHPNPYNSRENGE
jgi:hypothetical protein